MLIKEYRIPMPMSVEEYRIAQLYMIQVSASLQQDNIVKRFVPLMRHKEAAQVGSWSLYQRRGGEEQVKGHGGCVGQLPDGAAYARGSCLLNAFVQIQTP